MFFRRHEVRPVGPVYEWLAANKQQILDGSASYQGVDVNEKTELRQYVYVVSLLFICLSFKSQHMLPTPQNNYLRFSSLRYSLISLLFGWWCFPWGPILTIHSVFVNLTGGRRRSAIRLLQLIDWGWNAPPEVGVTEFQNDLVDLSPDAVKEIETRKKTGGFQDGVGVRITPTKWADMEVEIAFDYPVSDGRFWIDASHGMTLIIDKEHEGELADCTIDHVDGKFVARKGRSIHNPNATENA